MIQPFDSSTLQFSSKARELLNSSILQFFCFSILCLTAVHSQTTLQQRQHKPGAVGNKPHPTVQKPDIWLRSDQLDFHTGYWPDVSGNHRHALAATERKISSHSLNFHPVISFNGLTDNLKMFYDISQFSCLTVLIAFHSPDTLTEQGIWNIQINEKQVSALTDRNVVRTHSRLEYPIKKRGIPTINSSVQSWTKKRAKANDIVFVVGEATLPDSTSSFFKGDIAECLVFDKFLKKEEILKVETYLAIKYGITLVESDYISPRGDTLWKYRQNQLYSYSIAGIGKDSVFGLNQKQSCSTAEDELLTLSAGTIAATNTSNAYVLPEGSYLLCGHNNKKMQYENNAPANYPLVERHWLIQGQKSRSIPTTLKLKIPSEFQTDSVHAVLVIDRKGNADFSVQEIDYLPATRTDKNGNAYFENIYWDTDRSGFDIFTFSFGEKILPDTLPKEGTNNAHTLAKKHSDTSDEHFNDPQTKEKEKYYKVYPNPCKGDYKVEALLPEATEIRISVFTAEGALVNEWKDSRKKHYQFNSHIHTSGSYYVEVETSFGKETFKLLISK